MSSPVRFLGAVRLCATADADGCQTPSEEAGEAARAPQHRSRAKVTAPGALVYPARVPGALAVGSAETT